MDTIEREPLPENLVKLATYIPPDAILSSRLLANLLPGFTGMTNRPVELISRNAQGEDIEIRVFNRYPDIKIRCENQNLLTVLQINEKPSRMELRRSSFRTLSHTKIMALTGLPIKTTLEFGGRSAGEVTSPKKAPLRRKRDITPNHWLNKTQINKQQAFLAWLEELTELLLTAEPKNLSRR